MSFTTVADVAIFLNRDITTLSAMELAQINAVIPYMDGVINNYCGWNLLDTTYTDRRFSGNGSGTLDLRVYPINTLTTVKERTADGTFVDLTAGVEILEGGIISFLPYATTSTTTFTAGSNNIFVTFNAGYAVPNIPTELNYAASYLASINFLTINEELIGVSEEQFEQKTQKYSSLELPLLVKRALDRYRLISIF